MSFEKIADAINTVGNVLKGGSKILSSGPKNFVKPEFQGALGKRPNTFHMDSHSGNMYRVKQAMLKMAAIEASMMSEDYSPYSSNGSTQENKNVQATSNLVSSATYCPKSRKVMSKCASTMSAIMKMKAPAPSINPSINKATAATEIIRKPVVNPKEAPTLKYVKAPK